MDIYSMQVVIDGYSNDLGSLSQINPEMFENPVKFAMDLGEARRCIQLALMGRLSPDFAKRMFTDFHNLHKNDVINLHDLKRDFEPHDLN